jgi:hypothetical protein
VTMPCICLEAFLINCLPFDFSPDRLILARFQRIFSLRRNPRP